MNRFASILCGVIGLTALGLGGLALLHGSLVGGFAAVAGAILGLASILIDLYIKAANPDRPAAPRPQERLSGWSSRRL